jgi:hypothetical protein
MPCLGPYVGQGFVPCLGAYVGQGFMPCLGPYVGQGFMPCLTTYVGRALVPAPSTPAHKGLAYRIVLVVERRRSRRSSVLPFNVMDFLSRTTSMVKSSPLVRR